MVYGIIVIIDRIVSLLTYLIIIRALLSWIPSVDYRHPLMSLLIRVTDPVLVPVRRVMPPAGGFDLSPLVAILLLNLASQLLHQLLVSLLASG
ncbi:MAG: YggT family protein [Bacillati bacterium ANGP1]|uniref:YggT family protein n=1 Tax=Candidatus Segetimicrobium genomatis TaxID=2569760 RepID=A0A537K1T2_9BACT|nr:MAG: YggT family protein [Terrabacteria group bacterium ANGP1]